MSLLPVGYTSCPGANRLAVQPQGPPDTNDLISGKIETIRKRKGGQSVAHRHGRSTP